MLTQGRCEGIRVLPTAEARIPLVQKSTHETIWPHAWMGLLFSRRFPSGLKNTSNLIYIPFWSSEERWSFQNRNPLGIKIKCSLHSLGTSIGITLSEVCFVSPGGFCGTAQACNRISSYVKIHVHRDGQHIQRMPIPVLWNFARVEYHLQCHCHSPFK